MGKSLITKIIIGVVIAILLIIVISSIVKFAHRDRPDDVAEPIQEYIDQVKGKLVKSDNITNLYQAKLCIQKYYEYLCAIKSIEKYSSDEILEQNINANTAIQSTEPENRNAQYFKEVAYSMLAKDYADKKNITKENIDRLCDGSENVSVEIYKLYTLTNFDDIYVYFVNGIVRDIDTNIGKEINYIVAIDINNNTFEIYLDDYIDGYSDYSILEEGSEVPFVLPKTIEKRTYNNFVDVGIKYDRVARDMLVNIRTLMLYDTQKAYDLLSTAMKEKYPTYDSFKSYVDSKNKEIFSLTYGSYQLKSGENGMKFVIYNGDSSIKVTVDFDGFSSFKYSFEEMESYN